MMASGALYCQPCLTADAAALREERPCEHHRPYKPTKELNTRKRLRFTSATATGGIPQNKPRRLTRTAR